MNANSSLSFLRPAASIPDTALYGSSSEQTGLLLQLRPRN